MIRKKLIIGSSIIIGVILIIITYQAVVSTNNPSLELDFKNQSETISSYAGLIGALLSFLSIMFVLYNIIEDRDKILTEKDEEVKNKIEDFDTRFIVIQKFIETIINGIETDGKNILEFANEEIENPSIMKTMKFIVNKNYKRFSEIDSTLVYKIFKHKFSHIENWEEIYLELYTNIDFYGELLPQMREKYQEHTKDKYTRFVEISNLIDRLYRLCQIRYDDYIRNYDSDSKLGFIPKLLQDITSYTDSCKEENVQQDIEKIIDDIIEPFASSMIDFQTNSLQTFPEDTEILIATSDIKRLTVQAVKSTTDFANHLLKEHELNFENKEDSNFKNLLELNNTLKSQVNE